MSHSNSAVKTRYNQNHPCVVCKSGTKGCCATDGGLVFCRGAEDVGVGKTVNGYACVKAEPGAEFFTFKADSEPQRHWSGRARSNGDGRKGGSAPSLIDWTERHRKARERLTPQRAEAMAQTLGVPLVALMTLEPGFDFTGPANDLRGGYVFPMRDGAGEPCGLAWRDWETGEKKFVVGSKQGVIYSPDWRELEGPVYVPEGASDVAALRALGLPAVGRPSAKGGLQALADVLADCGREVIVLGERDAKDNFDWPGRDGAIATAKKLALAFRKPVSCALPPDGAKDVRDWLKGQGINHESILDEVLAAGERFAKDLKPVTVKPPEGGEDDPGMIQTAEDVPTLEDARAAGAEKRWLWPGWIQADALNGLVGKFGDGKTRFVMELVRRVRKGEPWPDGQPMTLPTDSTFLFVPLDFQHSELIDLAHEYDFPEGCVFINSPKDAADGVSPIDTAQGIAALERRIEVIKPTFVVVDPATALTGDRSLGRAEDATAVYGPLQRIARAHGATFLIPIHTNANGATYGRHSTGKFRTEMKLTKVGEAGDERYRLEVSKSNSKTPDPIGATQHDDRWEFDHNPPEIEQEGGGAKGQRGPKPTVDEKAVKFLGDFLGSAERKQVDVIDAWLKAGHAKKTLFTTAKRMVSDGELVEGETESPRGRTMLKTWQLKPPQQSTNGESTEQL